MLLFLDTKDTKQRFIKRIIGLPGESIQIKDGNVFITKDGKTNQLTEEYLLNNLKTIGEIGMNLNKDQFFVMGDNRDYSFDSRAWGVVPRSDIIGKAFLRILPLAALTKF